MRAGRMVYLPVSPCAPWGHRPRRRWWRRACRSRAWRASCPRTRRPWRGWPPPRWRWTRTGKTRSPRRRRSPSLCRSLLYVQSVWTYPLVVVALRPSLNFQWIASASPAIWIFISSVSFHCFIFSTCYRVNIRFQENNNIKITEIEGKSFETQLSFLWLQQ